MATRFYLGEDIAAPVSLAVDAGWEGSASPFAARGMLTTTNVADTLTTVSSFVSSTGSDRCHRQFISQPMNAGFVFNTSVTYICYIQCLESAANDNIRSRLCLRIVSNDGQTVRATVLAIADYSTGTEWNTALRNKAFANGDAGTGSYTTVAGDRLVVEIGHNDVTGSTISGSSRWGRGGSADLGENETSTATTERPWFETSLNLTFDTSQSLIPSLFSDSNTFYSPSVDTAYDLAPALYTDSNSFYVAIVTATYDLTPSLFTDSDIFFGFTVNPGAVDLAPSLLINVELHYSFIVDTTYSLTVVMFSDTEAFYSPTVDLGTNNQTLLPSLFSEVDSIFSAAASPGPVNLFASLHTDVDALYSQVAQASNDLLPLLLTNSGVFYSTTVTATYALLPLLLTDVDQLYNLEIAIILALVLELYNDVDIFFLASAFLTRLYITEHSHDSKGIPKVPPLEQVLDITSVSVTSSTFHELTKYVVLHANTACHIAWGTDELLPIATTANYRLAVNESKMYSIEPGSNTRIAVLAGA